PGAAFGLPDVGRSGGAACLAGELFAELLNPKGAAIMRMRAVCAEPTHQPLRDGALYGGGKEIVLDAHIDEPGGRCRGAVRVDRREHQVAGQRRLNGNAGRLEIADFADHDDVWFLAQDRSKRMREGETDAGVNLDLVDAGELVFDRILYGED